MSYNDAFLFFQVYFINSLSKGMNKQHHLKENESDWSLHDIDTNARWMTVQAISIACFIASVYVTIALLCHRCKSTNGSSKVLQYEGNSHLKKRRTSMEDSLNRKSVHLQNMTIAAAILVTLRIASEQMQLIFGSKSDHLCNVIVKTQIVLYAAPIGAIYGFLWARQRACILCPSRDGVTQW